MDLKSKHVLVTGSAKRLGRALTEFFVEQGARVSAHSHVTPFSSLKGATPFYADLCKDGAPHKLVQLARQANGPVDVLINSASVFYPRDASDCSSADWDETMTLNLKAPYQLLQACYQDLRVGGGCAINLCDIHVSKPLKRFAHYAASKGGLWTLTRSLALEWAPEIRVNSISPGAVLVPEGFTPEQIQRAEERSVLKRWGSAQDIVAAADFLIRNDYITGFDLKVDGGASLL